MFFIKILFQNLIQNFSYKRFILCAARRTYFLVNSIVVLINFYANNDCQYQPAILLIIFNFSQIRIEWYFERRFFILKNCINFLERLQKECKFFDLLYSVWPSVRPKQINSRTRWNSGKIENMGDMFALGPGRTPLNLAILRLGFSRLSSFLIPQCGHWAIFRDR